MHCLPAPFAVSWLLTLPKLFIGVGWQPWLWQCLAMSASPARAARSLHSPGVSQPQENSLCATTCHAAADQASSRAAPLSNCWTQHKSQHKQACAMTLWHPEHMTFSASCTKSSTHPFQCVAHRSPAQDTPVHLQCMDSTSIRGSYSPLLTGRTWL